MFERRAIAGTPSYIERVTFLAQRHEGDAGLKNDLAQSGSENRDADPCRDERRDHLRTGRLGRNSGLEPGVATAGNHSVESVGRLVAGP